MTQRCPECGSALDPPRILVTLDADGSSWALGSVDNGAWHPQATKPASARGTATPQEHAERDALARWAAAELGAKTVHLRLAANFPRVTWRVAVQQVS
ncbi:hypothetical protein F1721_04125 [Saccharopolyspora hirsuta]|uniref:Uncharacterized protein n=1 Tax=Saccharopolyspora hirsuta TaxID=1837 RepID=A0A5M7C6E1_SACHI|nr:hypothetical protein [Saccharopolyspora hirsuta]KAA5837020.1 hypothetical protein F1721_04125 [Saccharopolyspora hirsuta]